MMKNLRRKFLGYAIVLICLAAYSGASHAARSGAPKGEIAPAVKVKVEKALGALGTEIAKKAPVDTQSALALLTAHLGKNSYIYGAALAFAPAEKGGKLVKTSPYVYRSEGKLIDKDLVDSYDYTVQDWYVAPVKTRKPVWSKPYYDEGGGDAWMITYSLPIYSGERQPQLIGVLTSDLLIPSE